MTPFSRSTLILSSHLRLGFLSYIFPSGFLTNTVHIFHPYHECRIRITITMLLKQRLNCLRHPMTNKRSPCFSLVFWKFYPKLLSAFLTFKWGLVNKIQGNIIYDYKVFLCGNRIDLIDIDWCQREYKIERKIIIWLCSVMSNIKHTSFHFIDFVQIRYKS
jgi:hypothetical protein